MSFEAVLMIAFGGPEKPEDILPFLHNVGRGRRVPPARLEEVAHHYELIGGKSPLNELTFRQARALEAALSKTDTPLPVYVGMRNWRPYLLDTVRTMSADGVKHAVGVILAPQQSDSSWEKYQRNVADAIAQANVEIDIVYTQPFFNHPLFIEAVGARVADQRRHCDQEPLLFFTAHSVPLDDPFHQRYAEQIAKSAQRVIASLISHPSPALSAVEGALIAYQSRSGRPQDPWLEPDINDALRDVSARGIKEVVVVPIGFICDHVEVLYDLDVEAAATARELGLTMRRAKTVEDDPLFIECLAAAVRELVRNL